MFFKAKFTMNSSIYRTRFLEIFNNRLSIDVLWNYLAFIIMAVSGIVINALLTLYYGTEVLGMFNQTYAVFILFAQIVGGGIQLSELKYAGEAQLEPASLQIVVWSGVLLSCCYGLMGTLLLNLGAPFIGQNILSSPGASEMLSSASLGLGLYCVNKMLLSVYNARNWMKLYAVGQALRFIVFLVSIAVCCFANAPLSTIGATFWWTEGVLFIWLIVSLLLRVPFKVKGMGCWVVRHASFGAKAMLGGLAADINTRVDILMLGMFFSDSIVGVYSFSSMIADGFVSMLAVARALVSPQLLPHLKSKNINKLQNIIELSRKYSTLGIGVFSLITMLFFFPIAKLFLSSKLALDCLFLLAILLSGIVFYSGFMPLGFMLSQGGRPDLQTIFFVLVLVVNITLNLLFIPIWGVWGAAVATSLSRVSFVFLLQRLTWVMVGNRFAFKVQSAC